MIKAEVRFKNATFMNALEKSQYSSIAELSRISGIKYNCLIELAALKRIPKDVKFQVKLSELLNCDLYDLFEQYEEIVQKSKGKPIKISKDIPVEKMLSFDSKEIRLLESDYNTNDIDHEIGIKKEVDDSLNTLKEREKEVIKLHFGIGISEPWTLKDIAKRLGLSPERTRQIKERAIRRLRHRSRSEKLQSYAILSPSAKKDLTEFTSYDYSKKYTRLLEKEKREQKESEYE